MMKTSIKFLALFLAIGSIFYSCESSNDDTQEQDKTDQTTGTGETEETSNGNSEDNPNENLEENKNTSTSCVAPKELNLEILDGDKFFGESVKLTWKAGKNETKWKVDYKSNSSFGNDAVIIVENDPVLTITNIFELNKADITIWSVCSDSTESEKISFNIPGKLVGPIVAQMNLTIDGVEYKNWQPSTFKIFNSATTVVGNVNTDSDFLEIMGNSSNNIFANDEIRIFINENHWKVGEYILRGKDNYDFNYDTESYVDVRLDSDTSFEEVEKDGKLKILKFDTVNRIIEGEFSFEFKVLDDNTGNLIKTSKVTNGYFKYSLDDEEFDVR